MKRFIGTLAASLMVATSSGALTLSFEDVPGGSVDGQYGDMPTYQGYNFSSTLDWIDVVGGVWNYGAHSADFAILNNNGGIGSVTAADNSDFKFLGLWAKHWASPPESGAAGGSITGTLEGYNKGVLVWTINTLLNGSYQYFAAQDGRIDDLRLGFGTYFLVDDLALREGAAVVPVPAGLPLLLAGIGTVTLLARRKRHILFEI